MYLTFLYLIHHQQKRPCTLLPLHFLTLPLSSWQGISGVLAQQGHAFDSQSFGAIFFRFGVVAVVVDPASSWKEQQGKG